MSGENGGSCVLGKLGITVRDSLALITVLAKIPTLGNRYPQHRFLMSTASNIQSPAQSLSGLLLKGWRVGEKIQKPPQATGGNFSITYRATEEETRRPVFLKAVDLIGFIHDPDRLRTELNNFKYEENLLKLCQELRIDSVVLALDSGIHLATIAGIDVAVPFLVFEMAEGDLRTHEGAQLFNLSWRLRVFHGICVAMNALHRAEIAHQDLKPSNILIFQKTKAKVADLGRATKRNNPSNFEASGHQGDNNYKPIELQYNVYHEGDWCRRRLGADFFMMGCLLVYLLTDASLLTLWFERLDKRFWPGYWRGTYQEVVPHLEMALDNVISGIKPELPESVRDEVCQIICMLCSPNCERRGKPYLWGDKWEKMRDENPEAYLREQYSLEYLTSRVDVLANEARLGAKLNRQPFMRFLLGRQ